jgi:hypothetical protein
MEPLFVASLVLVLLSEEAVDRLSIRRNGKTKRKQSNKGGEGGGRDWCQEMMVDLLDTSLKIFVTQSFQ